MKANIIKIIILFFLMILQIDLINAQIILKIVPPDPESLLNWDSCEIHLINPDREDASIVLHMALDHDSIGLVYKAISDQIDVKPFSHQIMQWDTLVIRLLPFDRKLNLNTEGSMLLPTGFYTLCLFAMEPKKQKVISKDCLQIHIKH